VRSVPEPVVELNVTFVVNGEEVQCNTDVRVLLADLLRHELGLTGTHLGCEHGVCGACTVVMDGSPIRSCITLAVQADGSDIVTVEGINQRTGLNPMQQAFKDCHGLQCGFCTPGFLMTLETANPEDYPDEKSLRELLAGNLCRCTGYQGIVDAVNAAWGRNE